MISLRTTQVGNRLIRPIGIRQNFKTVLTESKDGKILTHVFDKDGKCILSRIKAFAVEQVGNKVVRTTTKVINANDNFMRVTTDRVYKNSNLVGSRALFESGSVSNDMKKLSVSKQGADDIRLQKYFDDNNIANEKEYKLGKKVGMAHFYNGGYDGYMAYNKKGLPMPTYMCVEKESDMYLSLRDMIEWKNNNYPNKFYAKPEFKLQKLDNIFIDETLVSSKNAILSKFLDKKV